ARGGGQRACSRYGRRRAHSARAQDRRLQVCTPECRRTWAGIGTRRTWEQSMGARAHVDKELTDGELSVSRRERIERILKAAFAPAFLDIEDQSGRHAGHAGASPAGETHFAVRMASARFEGQNRLARQRLVMEALRAEFESGLHALTMELKTPVE